MILNRLLGYPETLGDLGICQSVYPAKRADGPPLRRHLGKCTLYLSGCFSGAQEFIGCFGTFLQSFAQALLTPAASGGVMSQPSQRAISRRRVQVALHRSTDAQLGPVSPDSEE